MYIICLALIAQTVSLFAVSWGCDYSPFFHACGDLRANAASKSDVLVKGSPGLIPPGLQGILFTLFQSLKINSPLYSTS